MFLTFARPTKLMNSDLIIIEFAWTVTIKPIDTKGNTNKFRVFKRPYFYGNDTKRIPRELPIKKLWAIKLT